MEFDVVDVGLTIGGAVAVFGLIGVVVLVKLYRHRSAKNDFWDGVLYLIHEQVISTEIATGTERVSVTEPITSVVLCPGSGVGSGCTATITQAGEVVQSAIDTRWTGCGKSLGRPLTRAESAAKDYGNIVMAFPALLPSRYSIVTLSVTCDGQARLVQLDLRPARQISRP